MQKEAERLNAPNTFSAWAKLSRQVVQLEATKTRLEAEEQEALSRVSTLQRIATGRYIQVSQWWLQTIMPGGLF